MKRKNLFFVTLILLLGLIVAMAGAPELRIKAVTASDEISPTSTLTNTMTLTSEPSLTPSATDVQSSPDPATSTPSSTPSSTIVSPTDEAPTNTAIFTNTPSSIASATVTPSTSASTNVEPANEVLTGESLTNAFEELLVGNPEPAKALSCEADHQSIDEAAEALAFLSNETGIELRISCEVTVLEASCELALTIEIDGQEPIEESQTITSQVVDGILCGGFE
jgi:hypothetical protein